jgi:hypothetical protein
MAMERGAIDRQLREIGEGEQWWEQREFRDLPYILTAGEQIRGVVQAKVLGPRRPIVRLGRRWLVVVTDQRVICLKQQRFGRKQIDIAAALITAIRQGAGLRSYQITIYTAARKYRIRIRKDDAFRFTRAIGPLVPQPAVRSGPLEAITSIPGMSALAALPGFNMLVANLSPPQPDPLARVEIERLNATVEGMQVQVDRLQEQVAFLEDLLQARAAAVAGAAQRPRLPQPAPAAESGVSADAPE